MFLKHRIVHTDFIIESELYGGVYSKVGEIQFYAYASEVVDFQ